MITCSYGILTVITWEERLTTGLKVCCCNKCILLFNNFVFSQWHRHQSKYLSSCNNTRCWNLWPRVGHKLDSWVTYHLQIWENQKFWLENQMFPPFHLGAFRKYGLWCAVMPFFYAFKSDKRYTQPERITLYSKWLMAHGNTLIDCAHAWHWLNVSLGKRQSSKYWLFHLLSIHSLCLTSSCNQFNRWPTG